jgi:hypothetical protein
MRGNWGIQAGRGPLTYCLVVNRNEEPRHLMRRRCQGEIDASLSITFKDEAWRIEDPALDHSVMTGRRLTEIEEDRPAKNHTRG